MNFSLLAFVLAACSLAVSLRVMRGMVVIERLAAGLPPPKSVGEWVQAAKGDTFVRQTAAEKRGHPFDDRQPLKMARTGRVGLARSQIAEAEAAFRVPRVEEPSR